MTIYDILEKLRSDNSKLFKISVLEDQEDNELFKDVAHLAFDPFTQFYQRKIPDYACGVLVQESLDWGIAQLDYLSERRVTGNRAISHLKMILESMSYADAHVIECIIGKNLKCGVSAKTLNKVFGKGFIHEYPCMLASSYNEKNLEAITYPAIVQLKSDGMRANLFCDGQGKVECRSRSGKIVDLKGVFDEYVQNLFWKSSTHDSEDIQLEHYHSGVIDGELMVLADDGKTILDRKTGNGILNKAVKGTITEEEALRVRMIAWDLIPLDDFRNGVCHKLYFDRVQVLEDRLKDLHEKFETTTLINIAGSVPVNDLDEAMILFNQALLEGEEGVIIKNGDSIWENKRSKHQVKMKAELDIDLVITEWKEGSGRLEGKMGSVLAETSDGLLEVSIGSGFCDEERELTPEDVVGKIITVKYNEVIRDKNRDKASLFLPIYQELRQDKFTADKMPT
jgi:ATP-dependent DNA ligase